MDELGFELKIPKERIAVLIGKNGKQRKEIETATNTEINIDSKEGDVFIKGKDGLDIYTAKEIILAVGRGFNPELAMLLLKVDYAFELISIADHAKSKESQLRLKGRIIGKEGKTRKLIEDLTNTNISVFGKTASIIGRNDMVLIAKKAIDMLIEGSTHATVYKWLEKQRRQVKNEEVEW